MSDNNSNTYGLSILTICYVGIIIYGWTHEWSILRIIVTCFVVSIIYYGLILFALYYLVATVLGQAKNESYKNNERVNIVDARM